MIYNFTQLSRGRIYTSFKNPLFLLRSDSTFILGKNMLVAESKPFSLYFKKKSDNFGKCSAKHLPEDKHIPQFCSVIGIPELMTAGTKMRL